MQALRNSTNIKLSLNDLELIIKDLYYLLSHIIETHMSKQEYLEEGLYKEQKLQGPKELISTFINNFQNHDLCLIFRDYLCLGKDAS